MDDEIELSYNNISLRKSDINTFKNYSQLNDLSISFYYEYLNEIYKANQNYFTLLDPAMVFLLIFETEIEDLISMMKPLKIETKEFIFIPVNDIESKYKVGGGNHWALLFYQKSNQTFYYFDSMLSYIKNTNLIIKNLCNILNLSNPEIVCYDEIKYQQNTFDCGMFVLLFTEMILENLCDKQFQLKFDKKKIKIAFQNISQEKIPCKRKFILNLINQLKNR